MQAFAGLSMLGVGIATLVIGVRLLLLASRTRQLPELGFGIGFVSGSVGTALAQIGQRLVWAEPGAFATGMNGFCFGLSVLGTFFLYLVVWRVFRPTSRLAAGVVGVASLLAVVAWGMRLASGSFATGDVQQPGVVLFQLDRFALFSWSAYEAFRHSAVLRRRLRIGLADAVATVQIALWGIAGLALLPLTGVIVAFAAGFAQHPLETVGTTALVTVCTSISTGAMWCAFFPPRWLQQYALTRDVAIAGSGPRQP
jgi:hypothetical protein